MRKLSLLGGLAATIGSTAAFYILSNKKVRNELAKAKNPEATVKILTKYLGRDASKIANEVHKFFHSDDIQESLLKAKEFTEEHFSKAKDFSEEHFSKAKKLTEQHFSKAKSGFGGLLAKGKNMTNSALRSLKSDEAKTDESHPEAA